jgi:uncharacterized protein YcnI
VIPCLTWPRALALALVLVVLTVAPASAHPFVRGGEVPVDSLAPLTLATGHGCGDHDGGSEAATTEVVLEIPDWLRVVDVPADPGWDVEVEPATDAAAGSVTWSTAEPVEVAPDFAFDVVASGPVGETRFLRVVQRCGELTERWVGTPDEPADQPALGVRLVAADPDAPPPADAPADADEPPTAEDDPQAAADQPDPEEADPVDAAPVEAVEEGAGDADPTDATTGASTVADEDRRSVWWLVGALVVVGATVAVLVVRRRGAADAT